MPATTDPDAPGFVPVADPALPEEAALPPAAEPSSPWEASLPRAWAPGEPCAPTDVSGAVDPHAAATR
ncbi:MAG TPA: hypothetical protein VGQ80_00665, partial [Acidimicrobiia bacterium]|nr:hypothetical protein [Acidimicrobiia bacterium]